MTVSPLRLPRTWWGVPGAGTVAPTHSLAALLQARVLDAGVGALLWSLIARRVPVISVGGYQRHTGKTTLLNALLACAPADTEFVVTAGAREDFRFLDRLTPERSTILVAEFSDHTPWYLWGPGAARVVRATRSGWSFAGTMHASSVDDVVAQFTSEPVSLTPAELAASGALLVYQDFRETPAGVARRVTGASRLYPAPRGPGGLGAKSLAVWDPRDDTWNRFASEETWDELGAACAASTAAFKEEVAARTAFLETLQAAPDPGYDAVREALAKFRG